MINHLMYSFIFTVTLGLFSFNSINTSDVEAYNNNAFSNFDIENKIQQDTTPSRSRSRETYRTNDNGKKIYLSIVDGEIKKLKINGKKIPRKDYEKYSELIEQIKSSNNTPTPPVPPTPPNTTMEDIDIAHDEIEEAHLQIEEAHKEIEEAHKEIEKAHLKLEQKQNVVSDGMTQELIKEGLITNEEKYKIKLSAKKFKVNGKTQDKATHQKYVRLYEKLSGTKMNSNTVYQVNKNSF